MPILKPEDLVTPRQKTRAGFIYMALEKGYMAKPFIEAARTLKSLASTVNKPQDLLSVADLRAGLLAASGLSDKALNHLNEDDKLAAIQGLIDEFLIPANDDFVNELVYRYLLIKGDSLGGRARNLAGVLGERKVIRCLISIFNLAGVSYKYLDNNSRKWLDKPESDEQIENSICGFNWNAGNGERVLMLNIKVPTVVKNIDVALLDCSLADFIHKPIIATADRYLGLGELKGGIDPAGADEHWKTASKALTRIRDSFKEANCNPATFFIGAAIENSMAKELFSELKSGHLTFAANLTDDDQLAEICQWVVNL